MITGATQLAIFSVEGFIRAQVRQSSHGLSSFWTVAHGFQRWAYTQAVLREKLTFGRWSPEQSWPDGWLVGSHVLHARRSPMRATMDAIMSGREVAFEDGRPQPRINGSQSAGAIVRSVPLGAMCGIGDAFRAGAECAAFTHGGASAYLGSGFVARLSAGLAAGEDLGDAIAAARRDLAAWPDGDEIATASSEGAARLGLSPSAAALAVAIRVLREGNDPLLTIHRAHQEGGTAAAVLAGGLAGARGGFTGLPDPLTGRLDAGHVIGQVGDAASFAYRCWVLQSPVPGMDWEETWRRENAEPAVAVLWPDYPGW